MATQNLYLQQISVIRDKKKERKKGVIETKWIHELGGIKCLRKIKGRLKVPKYEEVKVREYTEYVTLIPKKKRRKQYNNSESYLTQQTSKKTTTRNNKTLNGYFAFLNNSRQQTNFNQTSID